MSTASGGKPLKVAPKSDPALAKAAKPSTRRKAEAGRKNAKITSAPAKPARLCSACQGKVSLSARYCRHCGLALSPEVPANPHLPPAPKPWRPSRIPKHRPAVAPLPRDETAPSQVWASGANPVAGAPEGAPTGSAPLAALAPPAAQVASPAPLMPAPSKPAEPQVWDPVPEVVAHIAQLKAQHERLRPQLARADLFKRRLRMP